MSNLTAFNQLIRTAGIKLANSTEIYSGHHQSGDPGLPLLVVENSQARAVIALQGAHLLSFEPKGQREMLWVSPKTPFEDGKPIRGGIPLCLPWFGPGADTKTLHGFARTKPWTLIEVEIMDDGATHLALELSGKASVCELWPHDFSFRLDILVGKTLTLGMTVNNHSKKPAPLAFAFHTYFAVPNVAAVRIDGLDRTTYIDKTDNFSRKTQQGEVTIHALTDRVYLDVPAQQTLKSSCGGVRIESDARCAVVWNAWTNDKNIPDLGEGNHAGYVCVERGDVADRALSVKSGGSYRTWMILSY